MEDLGASCHIKDFKFTRVEDRVGRQVCFKRLLDLIFLKPR